MAAREFERRLRGAVDGIWNQGNLDLADALVTADYVNHGGLIPDLAHGPEALKVTAVVTRLAFPGLRVTVDDVVSDSERFAVRWSARATLAAKPIPGVTFGRIASDQIAESWTYWEGPNSPGTGIGSRLDGQSVAPGMNLTPDRGSLADRPRDPAPPPSADKVV
jgi:hypothetical protein